ncbi:MAG TPA: hypothetical protein VL092_10735 [Chitinophagaceae bacterium]|nr:hypothetical protein [Chitinophagaceae bacterium]
MKFVFWYTIRSVFDKEYDELSWNEYVKWRNFVNVKEIVSLDHNLNEPLIDPFFQKQTTFYHTIYENNMGTGFFDEFNFLIKNIDENIKRYNLLTVVKEPNESCDCILEGYDFIGYDLLDKHYYSTSSVTNCGDWNGLLKPEIINSFGLINDFKVARKIQTMLREDFPEDDHADTVLFAVWRHLRYGQKQVTGERL